MRNFLFVLQLITSLLLSAAILLQTRGVGLGSAWGNFGSASWRTKRGAERLLFTATIVLATLFLALALVNILIF